MLLLSKSKVTRDFFLVISIALILRFALAVFLTTAFPGDEFDHYIDTQGYYLLSENLLQNHVFSGSSEPPFVPDNKRTPGFPLYLAGIQLLFGSSIPAFFFVNSMISAVTCGLAFLFYFKIFDQKTAVLASLFLAFDIESILCANYLITETLFTFLLVLAVYFLVCSLESKNISKLLMSITAMAAGIYVRPSGLVISILILLLTLIFQFNQGRFVRKRLILSIMILMIFLMPWYLRNYYQTGRFEFSSAGKSRMMRYWTRSIVTPKTGNDRLSTREQVYGMLNQETLQWLEDNPDFELSSDGLPISDIREYHFLELVEPQLSSLLRQNFVKVAANHIFTSFGTVCSSVIHSYNSNILHDKLDMGASIRATVFYSLRGDFLESWKRFFSSRHNYIEFISLLCTIAHFVLAASILFFIKDKQYYAAALICMIILYHIFISGVDALPRFLIPAMPFLFGLSAFSVMRIYSKFKSSGSSEPDRLSNT